MRRRVRNAAVLTAAIVAWASAAQPHAQGTNQDLCGIMRRLVDEAKTDFSRIDRPSGEQFRDSTLVLPHAKECYVSTDEFGGQYTCNWIVDSPAQGQAEFATLADGLSACFEPHVTVQRESDRVRARQRGAAVVTARWDRRTLKIRLSVQSDR